MKFRYDLMMLIALGAGLCGCSQEAPWSTYGNGEGAIDIRLSSSGSVQSDIPNVRAVTTDLVTPPVENFQIRVSSADGTQSQTWTSLSEFVKEDKFLAGTYHIEAYYGDAESQGIVSDDEEGHEHAFYYGIEQNVEVRDGETTTVQLQAALANSVVIVEYTDAFKNYFTSWATTLQTQGKSVLSLDDEEGTAYMVPGEVDIIIQATLQNGKSVTLNPATFEALPKHLYKIRYTINNGEVGQAEQLVITFNDNPEDSHNVFIDLTDELINSDAPVIMTETDSDSNFLEALEGHPFDGKVKFVVSAPGGIAEAKLSIKSDDPHFNPSFLDNGVIELVSASPAQISAMEQAGINVLGLFNNPDKMAQVDLSAFCRSLPIGLTEINLMVKDKISRINESPATVRFSTSPLGMDSEVKKVAWFNDGYGEVIINYNGPLDPTVPGSNPFSFKVQGDMNYVDSQILSINDVPYTRSFDKKEYVYKIKLPVASRDKFPVKIFYNGIEREDLATEIDLEFPKYNLEFDPLSSVIRMRVAEYTEKDGRIIDIRNNQQLQTALLNRMKIMVDGSEVNPVSKQNNGNGIITLSGYAAGSAHKIVTTMDTGNNSIYTTENTINMENAINVSNGNFSQKDDSKTINIPSINVGGQYNVTVWPIAGTYQNTSSIYREVPAEWSTVNDLTCYSGSDPKNTWFMVPSTFVENNVCTLRTVGYHHNGTVPSTSGGNMNRNYFCENTPSDLKIASGELFLGYYSYGASGENRNNGISFNTRPAKLNFSYSYSSYNSEKGEAFIKIYSGNEVIAQNSVLLDSSTSMKDMSLTLDNYPFGKKATKIEICFRSTASSFTPKVIIPTDLNEGVTTTGFTSAAGRTVDTNKYKAFAMGSELQISNVSLSY